MFCATRVFSAPHVAWRIACLWLRCVDGVVLVFVESLRVFQSFDTCVLREVGHCRDFFIVVGQLESRFTWVLKGVFMKARCSFQHLSFRRRDLWRQYWWPRKCGPEVHQCCVLCLWTMNVQSCPLPIHADVFVLTDSSSCSDGLHGPLCRSCLKPHGLFSQLVVICRLRVNSCERVAW